MPEVAIYAPGTPMWIDLATPDVKAAGAFYGGLFGWVWESSGPEGGGYGMFKLKGKEVAGAGPQQDPKQQPPSWSMYVATEDADETARRVKAAGGKVVAEPFDVMQAGRMAVFQDPAGAFFSVWQPNQHHGSEIVNEANAWGWSELNTNDIAGARKFYQKVFDWGIKENPGEPPYTEWQVKGRSVGGGLEALPPGVPPHWATYFNVDDIKAAAEKVKKLGGQVLMGPQDTPQGPFAVIRDPQGAVFQIIEFHS
jgi:uncharacterized protein